MAKAKAVPQFICECGCGQPCRRSFLSGHDTKLLKKLWDEIGEGIMRGSIDLVTAAFIELEVRGWLYKHPAEWARSGQVLKAWNGDPSLFVLERAKARTKATLPAPAPTQQRETLFTPEEETE
jgi:hypothetical protein